MSPKPQIPSWQRASSTDSPSSPSSQEQEPKPAEESTLAPVPTEQDVSSTEGDENKPEDSELLEQASRFLDDPAIRDAPHEKKVAFLQSKGVSAKDIDALLGEKAMESEPARLEEAGEKAWSMPPQKPTNDSDARLQPRDIPPIVTYPEFLASSNKPPPIMTRKRILNTAYVTGGLMASIYGLSKYIMAPMAENLASSRHDFASHTQEQLKDLNGRLAKSVSVDPASKAKTIADVVDDISEADSDPTELFHRDYGTQTTPSLSRRTSVSSDTDATAMVSKHEVSLQMIKVHLQELEQGQSQHDTSRNALRNKVSDLNTYLSDMSYQNQYYSNIGGFYGGTYGLPSGKDGKTDQIDVFKSDIRAVKGVFLSARNFPIGARGTSPSSAGRIGA